MALTLPAAPRRKTVWRRLSFAPATALPPKAIRPKPPATPSGRGNYPKAAELCEATAVIASQEDAVSPKWQEKKSRHWWRKDAARHRTNSGGVNGPPPAKPKARDAFLKRLAGRCFKCLASDHLVADCRDPVRCLRCRRSGHTSSSCPARRPRTISPNLRSRLKFPPESIHSRITFPPLPSTSKPTTPSTLDAVEMEHTPGFPSRRPTLGRTALVMTDAMSRAAARLLAHAVEVTMPEEGYRPSTLEVAYALSGQLHVPRLNIRVSRRNSDTFLAEFKMAPERDRAVGRGSIDIGGSSLPIRPWRSVGGAVERVWWYHAKVTLEKVPMEAWNEDGVRLILGDSCILDRLDSYSVEREQSEFLTCWVWMEDPDDLPRAVELSLFAAGAGRAFDINGFPSPTRIPASPPVGKKGESAILVHLAGYEDWRPRSPEAVPSGTSSETGSSSPPAWVPFTWVPGVLDGRRSAAAMGPRATVCRPPAPPLQHRDRDPEDDDRGPRRQPGELKSYRVRQLFPGCASSRSVRIRTQSPSGYRQHGDGGWRAVGELDSGGRGRSMVRSPPRTARGRDFIPHAAECWERRRSRSPSRLGGQDVEELLVTSSQEPPTSGRFDPMALEATIPPPAQSPHLCFYPDNSGEAPLSPEYAPTSLLGAGSLQEVKFGPGVQLGDDQPVYRATTHPPVEEIRDIEIADLVHRMEIDTGGHEMDEEGVDGAATAADGRGLFKELPSPLLPTPTPSALQEPPYGGRSRKTMASTRCSLRLAAKPSPVPVAQRAQLKLMKELDFVNGQAVAPDAAVTAYVDMYADDLPEQAIMAIRAATKMGNKKLVKVLAAMAEQAAGAAMEAL